MEKIKTYDTFNDIFLYTARIVSFDIKISTAIKKGRFRIFKWVVSLHQKLKVKYNHLSKLRFCNMKNLQDVLFFAR